MGLKGEILWERKYCVLVWYQMKWRTHTAWLMTITVIL